MLDLNIWKKKHTTSGTKFFNTFSMVFKAGRPEGADNGKQSSLENPLKHTLQTVFIVIPRQITLAHKDKTQNNLKG